MAHGNTKWPKLIVKSPTAPPRELDIEKSEFAIGRKPDNDLVIEDPAVSGHHARIVKIQEVYFLEDLKSTNGTFVNEQRTDRRQLRDTDIVKIGTHRLIYRDDNIPSPGEPAANSPAQGLEKTMILRGASTDAVQSGSSQVGLISVVSGKTDRSEYTLNRQTTVIGSDDDASIKLTGWFAPKTAAIIGRRDRAYYVATVDGGKPPSVNGQVVAKQWPLKDGDIVEVAGVRLRFALKNGT